VSIEPVIRPATVEDAAVIADIHNETIRARDATFEFDDKRPDDVRAWLGALHPLEAALVIEREGVVVGWGLVKRYSDRPGYRTTAETSVFLRRALRGQGLGTVLKRAVIERARSLGYHHLVARILASNEASIAYNQRLGYEIVGTQREVGVVDGRWCDVVLLQLLLEPAPGLGQDAVGGQGR
jgi:L-amino acid N-acyltransferase YncA